MARVTHKMLNDWYGRQSFDNVAKITSIDPWDSIDGTQLEEDLDDAKEVWLLLSFAEKMEWVRKLGE